MYLNKLQEKRTLITYKDISDLMYQFVLFGHQRAVRSPTAV